MVDKVELSRILAQSLLQSCVDEFTQEDLSKILREISDKNGAFVAFENGELSARGEGDLSEAYLDVILYIYEEMKLTTGAGKARTRVIQVLGPVVSSNADGIHEHNMLVRLPAPIRKYARTKPVSDEIVTTRPSIETPAPADVPAHAAQMPIETLTQEPPKTTPVAEPGFEQKPPAPSAEQIPSVPVASPLPRSVPPSTTEEKPTDAASQVPTTDDVIAMFAAIKGISVRRAKRLYHSGIRSQIQLRQLQKGKLAELLHIPESRAEDIYAAIHALSTKKADIEVEDVETSVKEDIAPTIFIPTVPEQPAPAPEGARSPSYEQAPGPVAPAPTQQPPLVVQAERPIPAIMEKRPDVIPMVAPSTGKPSKRHLRKLHVKRVVRRRFVLLAVLVVLTLLITGFAILLYPIYNGAGDRWEVVDLSGVLTYSDPPNNSIDANVDIVHYAIALTPSHVTMMSEVRLSAFSEQAEYGVLMDNDGNPSTGYMMKEAGIGADYRIVARGMAGNISGTWYSYEPSQDRMNWSAWKEQGRALVRVDGSKVLLQVPRDVVGYVDGSGFRFYSMTQGAHDLSEATVSFGKPALYMRSVPGDARIVDPSSDQDLMEVRLEAKGGSLSANLSYASQNLQSVPAPTTIALKAGESKTFQVSARGSGASEGLASLDAIVQAQGAVVTTAGRGYKGYVQYAPSAISIDGAFADWDPIAPTKDPSKDVADPNVDILTAKGTNSTSKGDIGLYASVAGGMLSGLEVPMKIVGGGGGGGGGGVIVLPRVSGRTSHGSI